jgi:hypothetical protein
MYLFLISISIYFLFILWAREILAACAEDDEVSVRGRADYILPSAPHSLIIASSDVI